MDHDLSPASPFARSRNVKQHDVEGTEAIASRPLFRSMVMAGASEPVLLQQQPGDGHLRGLKGDGRLRASAPGALYSGSYDCSSFLTQDEQRNLLQSSFSTAQPTSSASSLTTTSKPSCWTNPQAPAPSFCHFLEFHHTKLNCNKIELDELASGLRCIFGQLSLQTVYQDAPMAAHCSSSCAGQVGLSLSVLRDNTAEADDDNEMDGSAKWIIEVQRRSGDSFAFNNLARQIIQRVQQLTTSRAEVSQAPPPSFAVACRQLPTMSQAMKLEQYLASVTPYASNDEQESDESLAHVVSRQLESEMYHEQRMGLEALVNATDLSKTLCQSCLKMSKALLLVDEEPSSTLQQVVGLALGAPVIRDTKGLSLNDFAAEHAHLALMAVSNALQAVEPCDVEKFVRKCNQDGIDVLALLVSGISGQDLGRAYHSVAALNTMCNKVPMLRLQVNHEVIQKALVTGQSVPHASLELASQVLLDMIDLAAS